MDSDSKIPFVLVDAPHAPEVFATCIAGIGPAAPGVLRLTFMSTRANHSDNGSVSHVENLRLVMSTPCVKNMIEFLQNYLTSEQQSVVQRPPDQMLQ